MLGYLLGGRILKVLLFSVFAFLLVMNLLGYLSNKNIPDGRALPVIELSNDGKHIDLLAMSRGKPTVLYFWADWCIECRTVNSAVQEIADEYPLVSVSLNSSNDRRLKHYMVEKELTFPVISDLTGEISMAWSVTRIPLFVVVLDGQVKFITSGYTTRTGLQVRLWLAHAVMPWVERVQTWFNNALTQWVLPKISR